MNTSFRFALQLFFAGMTSAFAAEVVSPADATAGAAKTEAQVEGASSKRQFLPAKEASETFDGATFTRIVHQDGRRVFRYSPPSGWTVKAGQRAEFSAGKFMATVGLALASKSPGKAKDVAAKGSSPAVKENQAERPAFQIAGQPAERNLTTEVREGGSHLRMRARSLGEDWQVELLLEGPREGFDAAEQQLLGTVANISVQTETDLQKIALEREVQTQMKMAQERKAASRPAPTGPVRGRLE